jgi:two-component system cell cycle sensor histidine kinase PleC
MSEVTAEMIERGRRVDPAAAAHRRRLALKVRDAREKLTSTGSGYRAFDVELLRVAARSRMATMPIVAGIVIGVSLVAAIWVAPSRILVWTTLVFIGLVIHYSLARTFLEREDVEARIRVWRLRFILAEMLQNAIWALIAVLVNDTGDPAARTFVIFVLLLASAITVLLSSTIPSAAYAGLVPLTFGIVAYMQPSFGIDTLPLNFLVAAAQIFFIILAHRLYTGSLATLSFRAEKDVLIAELEQAKANSDEARRRAEEANLAKSRFLATMSHELRTPLNAILGFSEVMKSELFGAHVVASYKEYASDIHSSGQHLLTLINEILDLSRVEAGRLELKEEALALGHIVDDCRHLLAIRAKNRNILVSNAFEPGLPRIWADERAVRQVTLNLLSNAIKFTPQGGTITIKVGWTASGGQYLSVKDTGPGIPENEIPIVLSSFGRGSLAQKNADEGSGLGLPIVKGLIELHGGSFVLKSKVREGTEAIVVFPPERVMDALPQIQLEDGPGVGQKTPRRSAMA